MQIDSRFFFSVSRRFVLPIGSVSIRSIYFYFRFCKNNALQTPPKFCSNFAHKWMHSQMANKDSILIRAIIHFSLLISLNFSVYYLRLLVGNIPNSIFVIEHTWVPFLLACRTCRARIGIAWSTISPWFEFIHNIINNFRLYSLQKSTITLLSTFPPVTWHLQKVFQSQYSRKINKWPNLCMSDCLLMTVIDSLKSLSSTFSLVMRVGQTDIWDTLLKLIYNWNKLIIWQVIKRLKPSRLSMNDRLILISIRRSHLKSIVFLKYHFFKFCFCDGLFIFCKNLVITNNQGKYVCTYA